MSAASATAGPFAPALAVADAVLYEGYLLFPYTASSAKNRVRWQFGVVVPEAYLAAGTGETADAQTEVLVERAGDAPSRVTLLLRFLQVEARRVEALGEHGFAAVDELTVAGTRHITFDEGVACVVPATLDAVAGTAVTVPVTIAGGIAHEQLGENGAVSGRIVRERWPLAGTLSVTCEAVEGSRTLCMLSVRVANHSTVVAGERAGALRTAFVSSHVLLHVDGGAFVSVLDPVPGAADATAALRNRHLFPVLVGDGRTDARRAQLMLASPIILYDFPEVAQRTDADQFDATEIDELLTLSVLSLPDAERDEARATDPRARAVVERAERFGAREIERVHAGALFPVDDPFAAVDVPALDCVFVDGVKVSRGSTVRLHPKRRADAWDMFLRDRIATVRAIHQDVEDVLYVAVTVDDDPASDLHDWYGRSFFFSPDEIEPLERAR